MNEKVTPQFQITFEDAASVNRVTMPAKNCTHANLLVLVGSGVGMMVVAVKKDGVDLPAHDFSHLFTDAEIIRKKLQVCSKDNFFSGRIDENEL